VPVEPLPGAGRADGDGIASVWLALHEPLRSFAARRVRNVADADDIVQSAFLQLQRHRAAIRDESRVRAWLYRTTRRGIADHHRSRHRKREVPSGHGSDLEAVEARVAPAEDSGAEHLEVAACLAPLLGGLPAADREAIALADVRGLRLADLAGRLRLSISGTKSRVQRARRRLRHAMLACCRIAFDARGLPIACARPMAAPAAAAACGAGRA
jgi:RNA polymerase sigma-70 factor (ECF subfamily)